MARRPPPTARGAVDIRILPFAGQPETATAAGFYYRRVVCEAMVLLLRKVP
jgi:hypothetical protein